MVQQQNRLEEHRNLSPTATSPRKILPDFRAARPARRAPSRRFPPLAPRSPLPPLLPLLLLLLLFFLLLIAHPAAAQSVLGNFASSVTFPEGGGSATVTFYLSSAPSSPVAVVASEATPAQPSPTVTLAPDVLLFTPAAYSQIQTITLLGVGDASDRGDSVQQVTYETVSDDGAFSGLTVAATTVTLVDDDTAAWDGPSPSAVTAAEGGALATTALRLATYPTSGVTVSMTSTGFPAAAGGLLFPAGPTIVFDASNWSDFATATLSAVDDAWDANAAAVSGAVDFTPSSDDGAYAALPPVQLAVDVTDDDTAGMNGGGGALNVGENGGTDTVVFSLDTRPSVDVTIAVLSSQPSIIAVPSEIVFPANTFPASQTVTVTGVNNDVDHATPQQSTISYTVSSSSPTYGTFTTRPSTIVTATDDDTAGLIGPAPSTLVIDEDGAGDTFRLKLDTAPTALVTISLSSSDPTEATLSTASIVFSPGNFNTQRTVTVNGVDDNTNDGNGAVTVTGTLTSSDGDYSGFSMTPVAVTVTEDDIAGISGPSPASNTILEDGATTTFTVRLDAQPASFVTVASPATGHMTASPGALVFTIGNYDSLQTVTVTSNSDDIDQPSDQTGQINFVVASADGAYDTMVMPNFVLTVTDNDNAAFTVSPTATVTVDEASAGQQTFSIHLATEPASEVKVGFNVPGQLTATPSSISFSTGNWATLRTFTVTAVDNGIDHSVPQETVTVTTTITGDAQYVSAPALSFSVQITDDETAGVTGATTHQTIAENGGTATATFNLDTAPTSQVTFSLGGGVTRVSAVPLVFASGYSGASLTFTVVGVDNVVDENDFFYNAIPMVATSDDTLFHGIAIPDRPTVTLTDDDTAGVTLSGAPTLSFTEGTTSPLVDVTLNTQPTVAVRVSFTATAPGVAAPLVALTFTSGNWNVAQSLSISAVDNNVVSGTETTTIASMDVTSVSGPYNGLFVSPPGGTITVFEDDSVGITQNGNDASVTEGATGIITFVLNSEPTSPVTVTASFNDGALSEVAAAVFAPAAWSLDATLTVSGVDDGTFDTDDTVTVSFDVSSGDGAYDGIADPADISITVLDDDGPGVIGPSGNSVTNTEGLVETATVHLNSVPTSSVTIDFAPAPSAWLSTNTPIIFSPACYSNMQTLTVSWVTDIIDYGAPSEMLSLSSRSDDNLYHNVYDIDFTLTLTEDDTAAWTTVPNPAHLTLAEALGEGTVTIVPSTTPTSDVVVSIAPAGFTVTPTDFTFSSGGFATPLTITFTASQDVIDYDPELVLTPGVSITSADGQYDGTTPTVSITVTDDDTAGLTLATPLALAEAAGTESIVVDLDTEPVGLVTVSFAKSNSFINVSPMSLTFDSSNYASGHTIDVTAVDDAIDRGTTTTTELTVTLTSSSDPPYNGLAVPAVTVTVNDDDSAGATLSPASGDLTVLEASGQGVFTFVFSKEPSFDVTIRSVSGSPSDLTISTDLTFTTTNYALVQTMTVTAVPNQRADATHPIVTITHTYETDDPVVSALGSQNPVDVTITDDDTASVNFVSATSVTLIEGSGTDLSTFVLTSEPYEDVVVSITSGDLNAVSVVPDVLVFSSVEWNVQKTVTLSSLDDTIAYNPDHVVQVSFTILTADTVYASIPDPTTNSVTIDDDDVAGITSPPATAFTVAEAGGTHTFSFTLLSSPLEPVTITPVQGSGDVSGSVLVFDSNNWAVTQVLTLEAQMNAIAVPTAPTYEIEFSVTSDDSVYDTLPHPPSATATVTDDDTAGVLGLPTDASIAENMGTQTYLLSLQSEPTGGVTIAAVSTDTNIVTSTPASITFGPGNWNSNQAFTVTAVPNAFSHSPDQTVTFDVTLTSNDDYYDVMDPPDAVITVIDDDDVTITGPSTTTAIVAENMGTTEQTFFLDSQPSESVTIVITTSTADLALSDNELVFTTATWSLAQVVTATGVPDNIDHAVNEVSTINYAVSSNDPAFGIVASPLSTTVTLTDDDTAGLVEPTLSATIDETGSNTHDFVFSIDTEPTADVVISAMSADPTIVSFTTDTITFNAGNYLSPATIVIRAENNDIDHNINQATSIVFSLTSADPVYDAIADPANAPVSVTDDDTAAISAPRPLTQAIAENGGTETWTFVLQTEPVSTVTFDVTASTAFASVSTSALVFDDSNWSVVQTVTAMGVIDDIDYPTDRSAQLDFVLSSSDGPYNSLPDPSSATVTVIDDDIADVSGPDTLSTFVGEEGGTSITSFVLLTEPLGNVDITATVDDPTFVSLTNSPVVFTPINWSVPKTITFVGVSNDIDHVPDPSVQVTYTVASADTMYNGFPIAATTTVDVTDDEIARVVDANLSAETIDEMSGLHTMVYRLETEPETAVTISVTSGDTSIATSSASMLVFTSTTWSVEQTVTASAVPNDVDHTVDQSVAFTYGVSTLDSVYGGVADPGTVVLTVTDDDTANVVTSSATVSPTEAATVTVAVSLSTEPLLPVTVSTSTGDSDVATFVPPTFTFTSGDYNTAQTLTISAVSNDIDHASNQMTTLSLATLTSATADEYSTASSDSTIAVTSLDNDARGGTLVSLNCTMHEAGGTAEFSLVLDSEPLADVTATVGIAPVLVTASADLTFNNLNWSVEQTVTVTGIVDDTDSPAAPGPVTSVSLTAESLDTVYDTVVLATEACTVVDDDLAGIYVLTATMPTLLEGGAASPIVIVPATRPEFDVVATLDLGSEPLDAIPPSLTFTPSNYLLEQTFMVSATDDEIEEVDRTDVLIGIGAVSTDPHYAWASSMLMLTPLGIVDEDEASVGGLVGINETMAEVGIKSTFDFTIALQSEPTFPVTVVSRVGDEVALAVTTPSIVLPTTDFLVNHPLSVAAIDNDVDPEIQPVPVELFVTTYSDDPFYNGTEYRGSFLFIDNNDWANVTIGATTRTITESGNTTTATYTVVLETQPERTTLVSVTSNRPTVCTVEPSELRFTTASYSVPKTVTVSAVNDLLGPQPTAVIRHVASGDVVYAREIVADVTVTVVNDDPAPVIQTVRPPFGPIVGGALVTVSGSHFLVNGTHLGSVDFVDLGECAVQAAQSSGNKLICRTPSVAEPSSAPVRVATVSGSVSGGLYTYYDTLKVEAVSPPTALVRESLRVNVSVHGDEPFKISSADTVSIRFGSTPCTDVVVEDTTTVSCVTGDAGVAEVGVPVVVVTTARGVLESDDVFFSFNSPRLLSVSPARGTPVGGDVLTLRGFRIGDVLDIQLGDLPCNNITSVNDGQVTCITPSFLDAEEALDGSGAFESYVGQNLPVSLETELGGLASSSVTFLSGDATPVIKAFAPADTVAGSGTTVVIVGANMGFFASDIDRVTVAGVACADIVWKSPEELSCTFDDVSEPLASKSLVGSVIVYTKIYGSAKSSADFAYLVKAEGSDALPPLVDAIEPNVGSHKGGLIVTVTGRNFGTSGSDLVSILVAGVPCLLSAKQSFVDSTKLICQTASSNARALNGPVVVSTLSGGASADEPTSSAYFRYTYPPPIVEDVYPRISLPDGGSRVTIVGENFGDSDNSTVVVYIEADDGSISECTSVIWVSDTEVSCELPDGDLGTTATFEVIVGGQSSKDPLPDGSTPGSGDTPQQSLAFVAEICEPECGRYGDCDLEQSPPVCFCHPGFMGAPKCDQVALVVLADGVDVANNFDGDLFVSEGGDNVVLDIALTGRPEGIVRIPFSSSDTSEADFSPSELEFTPDNYARRQKVSVSTPPDGLRDGSIRFSVIIGPAVSDDPIFDGALRLSLPFVSVDSAPVITLVDPLISPLNGTNMTIYGKHYDAAPVVTIGGVVVPVEQIALERSSTDDSDLRRRQETGNGTIGGAEEPIDFSLVFVPDVARAAGPDNIVALSFRSPVLVEGYHKVRIVNGDGLDVELGNALFYTDDCPFVGAFGRGEDCAECPPGGICPGGYRMWARPGYWTPDETAGFVEACDPPEACTGTRSGVCAAGYQGAYCGQCESGYYNKNGACRKCPESDSILIALICDIIVWVMVAVAGALLEDRENFGHVISFVLMVQTVAGVGRMISHKLPDWLLSMYEIFHLFSGDIAFLKPDCQGNVDYTLDFVIAIAYNVAIATPLFFAIAVARFFSIRSAAKNDDPLILKERREFYYNRFYRAGTVWVTIIYYSVTTRVFGALYCEPSPIEGEALRLNVDKGIVCFSDQHLPIFAASAILFFLVTIGWPAWYQMWLVKNKRYMYVNRRFDNRWDFLSDPFRRRWKYGWWAEFVVSIVMALGDTILSPYPVVQLGTVGGIFFLLATVLLISRPLRRNYENYVFAGVYVANLCAMILLYLSRVEIIATGSTTERILVYVVAALIAIATLVLFFVLSYHIFWVRAAQDHREGMLDFLAKSNGGVFEVNFTQFGDKAEDPLGDLKFGDAFYGDVAVAEQRTNEVFERRESETAAARKMLDEDPMFSDAFGQVASSITNIWSSFMDEEDVADEATGSASPNDSQGAFGGFGAMMSGLGNMVWDGDDVDDDDDDDEDMVLADEIGLSPPPAVDATGELVGAEYEHVDGLVSDSPAKEPPVIALDQHSSDVSAEDLSFVVENDEQDDDEFGDDYVDDA